MAAQLGGEVQGGHHGEYGRAEVEAIAESPLLEGVWEQGRHTVWMSHGDRVTKLPPGFNSIGHSPNAPVCVIADEARRFYGLQFHPEVHHTPEGPQLLGNFLFKIAGFRRRLDDARLPRRGDQGDPRAGRAGARALRALGRRRFIRRRAADP